MCSTSTNATHVIGSLSDVTTRLLNATSLSTTSCTWLAHSRVATVTMQLLSTVWTSAEPIGASSTLKINGSTTLTINASVGRIEAGTLLVEKVHQPWAARRAEDEARVLFLF